MEMFISFFTGKVMLFYGITLIMKEKSNASALRWEQTRTSQGADSDVAGARFECRSSQMRVWLVLDALTGIGNETAARVPQFSAYALRRRSKTYCFRTPS